MFKRAIEQDLINVELKKNAPLTELQFYARELTAWRTSPERREMIDGDRYYVGDHPILYRKRTIVGADGQPEEVDNVPNSRIIDNQYAKHVDQKADYLLGKPITFQSGNKNYASMVQKVLGAKFMRTLKLAGVGAFNSGKAWLYPYYDETGKLAFKMFPGYEVLPFWEDSAHTKLETAARLYPVEVYKGQDKEIIDKVDIFDPDGVRTFIFSNGSLIPDGGKQNYLTFTDDKGEEQKYNWGKTPLIAIKYNANEIPLIRRARSIQDAINLLQSDFVNNMQEDAGTTIIVLKNYDGANLGEFRHNLSTYRAIKVRSVDGVEGGVEALHIEVNSENYRTVLELLKKALIENMRSYDAKDDRLGNNPNQMNIQSMYSDIDLDSNAMETELQAAFEDILWYVDLYLANSGQGDFTEEDIEVIFNRDVLINESETIDNCTKSVGVLSTETIVSQHPWVTDVEEELRRLEEEKKSTESDPYRQFFENGLMTKDSDRVGGGDE